MPTARDAESFLVEVLERRTSVSCDEGIVERLSLKPRGSCLLLYPHACRIVHWERCYLAQWLTILCRLHLPYYDALPG